MTERSRGIECRPGESEEDFIARIVATSGTPDAELAAELRHLLPPVPRTNER
ncbi:hypothetical protein [Amycolatopsis sp. NPDC051128]|uniref:hypothetical protein n=1 Tax=Amycolatopsis sp. NPDC051128 TaxID=3155412 RepID=UPI00341F512E